MEKLRGIIRQELDALFEGQFSGDYKNKPRKAWTDHDHIEFDRDRYMTDAYERQEQLRKIKAVLLADGDCEQMLRDIAKVIGGLKEF